MGVQAKQCITVLSPANDVLCESASIAQHAIGIAEISLIVLNSLPPGPAKSNSAAKKAKSREVVLRMIIWWQSTIDRDAPPRRSSRDHLTKLTLCALAPLVAFAIPAFSASAVSPTYNKDVAPILN